MNTQQLDQKINEIEKAELLEDFKIEELEQRFEMGWNDASVSTMDVVGPEPNTGDTAYMVGYKINF
ncbi:hypothetical protein [Elizabethkingia miricola]|uniref:hypothetical protein n=1 Tax=Elizabethkingia miricola TaxID=172045 RepID=UPI000B35A923|nr:hypothetical protein [Elizabethkingia miricola]NHQ66263.1 hypothetical protein [Elizabethkingia miricola]NHQ72842.1 hypothetical protein [Elizabethkingia miricola]PSL88157.1 hypothetical protein C7V10_11230 [Elizabethkingia miricola]QHQ87624.1 hypothetical protein FE632_12855 [Elizabethkingia miricola]UIO95120.1 hypothetical protein LYZ41_13050 [Elizabethkingia miricola]